MTQKVVEQTVTCALQVVLHALCNLTDRVWLIHTKTRWIKFQPLSAQLLLQRAHVTTENSTDRTPRRLAAPRFDQHNTQSLTK
jgi:hypothetical protein